MYEKHSPQAIGDAGSIYLSEPLYLTNATACAIVLEPGATLFALAWGGQFPPFVSTPLASAARQYRLGLGSSPFGEVSFLNIDQCVSCAIGGGGIINPGFGLAKSILAGLSTGWFDHSGIMGP